MIKARVAMTLTRLAPPLFLVAADFDGAKKVLDEAAQLNLELGQQRNTHSR